MAMTSNGDEKILRELFRKLRGDVDNAAPPFPSMWEAANFRLAGKRTGLRRLRLALTVAAITIVVGSGLVVWLRSGSHVELLTAPAEEVATARSPGLGNEPPRVVTSRTPVQESGGTRTRPSQKRLGRAGRLKQLTALSSWRSPTGLLLRSPGEELLRTNPAVSEPIGEITPVLKHRIN